MSRVAQFIELINDPSWPRLIYKQADQRIRASAGPKRNDVWQSDHADGDRHASSVRLWRTDAADPAADESKFLVIKAPMVGTVLPSRTRVPMGSFFPTLTVEHSWSPLRTHRNNTPPFVKVG